MFGMTFGNESPARQGKLEHDELVDALVGTGIISGPGALNQEEVAAIKTRMGVIKNKLAMSDDSASVLAYVDRKLAVESASGNQAAVAELVSKVSPDIVSTIVDARLAHNEEFLGTVLTLADKKYLSGSYSAFSDALIEAVKEREAGVSASGVEVKLDAQDNVIQPADTELH
jgi:hypothetical protein